MKADISTQISQSETGQGMLSTTRSVRDRMALLSSTFERVVRGDSVEGEYKRGEDALEGMLLSEGSTSAFALMFWSVRDMKAMKATYGKAVEDSGRIRSFAAPAV